MHIGQGTIKRHFGSWSKANLTVDTVTKLISNNQLLIVKCVELNERTPTGKRKKRLRILRAEVIA